MENRRLAHEDVLEAVTVYDSPIPPGWAVDINDDSEDIVYCDECNEWAYGKEYKITAPWGDTRTYIFKLKKEDQWLCDSCMKKHGITSYEPGMGVPGPGSGSMLIDWNNWDEFAQYMGFPKR